MTGGFDVGPAEPVSGEPGPPVSPRRSGALRVATSLAIAVIVLGAGVGLGAATRDESSPSNATTATTAASPPSSREQQHGPSDGLSSGEIATRVNPVIVDINTTLPGRLRGAGTGMVIDASGVVLTNNHVIEGATSITVQVVGTSGNVRADVIGADAIHDVAVIQMRGVQGLATVTTAPSSEVLIGDRVVAIGNALGRGGTPTVTEGVISATDQSLSVSDLQGNAETLHGMIQIAAEIQPGDSGGPLLDTHGRVVGMTTAASAATGIPQEVAPTVGFAIPIDTALSIARQLRTGSAAA